MAVTWIGASATSAVARPRYWPEPGGQPPRVGDLIVMLLPESDPVPAGWTESRGDAGRACWRYADGAEQSFPFPAAWYSGVEPASDSGLTASGPEQDQRHGECRQQ